MKKILLLVAIVIFMPFALAIDNKIFDGWAIAGTPFNIGNDTFLANYILDSNSTIVYLPEGISAVIYASSMNCTQEWLYTICQDKQRFQVNGNDVPPDVRSNSLVVSVHLKINKTDAGIRLDNDFDQSQIFLGDSANVKISVDKIGQPDIYNLSFNGLYPGFSVDALSGDCIIKGDTVNLAIKKFDRASVCSYRIIPQKVGAVYIITNVSYVVLDKSVNKASKKQINILDSPADLKVVFNKTSKMLENISFWMLPNAGKDSEMKELRVELPPTFSVLNPLLFSNNNNILKLSNPTNISYSFSAMSRYSGNMTFNVTIIYSRGGLNREVKKSYPIEILPALPTMQFFKNENSSVIRISNTEDVDFKNIKIYASGTVFDLPLLEKNRFKEFAIAEKNNMTKVALDFDSEFGQHYKEEYSLNYQALIAENKNKTITNDIKKAGQEKIQFAIPNNFMIAFIIVALVAALSYIFLRSRSEKSALDKEIDDIRKNNKF